MHITSHNVSSGHGEHMLTERVIRGNTNIEGGDCEMTAIAAATAVTSPNEWHDDCSGMAVGYTPPFHPVPYDCMGWTKL